MVRRFLKAGYIRVSLLLLSSLLFSLLVSAVLWFLAQRYIFVSLLLRFLSVTVAFYICARCGSPAYKLAWVMLILLFPTLGGVIYLFCLIKLWRHYQSPLSPETPSKSPAHFCGRQAELCAAYIKSCTGLAAHTDCECEYFSCGRLLFERLCEELSLAKRYIFMEYFIIADGYMSETLLSILGQKRKENVEIYVIFDDLGTVSQLPKEIAGRLIKIGASVKIFNPCHIGITPVSNFRDHRKITVIDGAVGFCGGINISDEYINRLPLTRHWKDTALMLKGAAVKNLEEMFLSSWYLCGGNKLTPSPLPYKPVKAGGAVQPFGDSPFDGINIAENLCIRIISAAERYFYLTTPYLVPSNEMLSALCTCARCGVDVRIITPRLPDKWYVHLLTKSNYAELLRHGVRIYEYTPGFIHAKQLICDGKTAMVGTTNLDYRSFNLHFEAAVCLYEHECIKAIEDDFAQTLAKCTEVTLEKLPPASPLKALLLTVLRTLSPLF